MKFWTFFYAFLFAKNLCGQTVADTAAPLPEVTVKAFEQNRKQREVAAAVSVVGAARFQHFSPAAAVQAVNTVPGVRLEERSPGSYRINLRGSSLRSPFGVRNVKVYFNDLPLTDPGGNTYFNQLGVYNLASVEIIKGPGSSLYGAGTGGVLLIESLAPDGNEGLFAETTVGSYGLRNAYASVTTVSPNFTSRTGFQHQQSEGYRQHSRLRREVLAWTGLAKPGPRSQVKTSFLYGDLFYQTPGALTKTEFERSPQAARPGNGTVPGAVQAGASVAQKQVLAGASLTQNFSTSLALKTAAYALFTDFRNPAIANYTHNTEPHGGLRTAFDYTKALRASQLRLLFGGEWQQGWPSVSVHKNANGRADSLRSRDAQRNRQVLLFAQAVWENQQWQLAAGTGFSWLNVQVERFSPTSSGVQTRRFNNGAAPRLSVLRKGKTVNVYAALAKGFSPPTTAELLPTGGSINLDLNAESGWNYELGAKGRLFRRLAVDVNLFRFGLRNAIVQRRTAAGSDYYVNAGQTAQWGVETALSAPLFRRSHAWSGSNFWLSHTYHNFRYVLFRQLNNDYTGNRLPATPRHSLSTGIELTGSKGFEANANYYFAGRVPLNDANSEFAAAYHLVGIKAGYQRPLHRLVLKLSAGIDNLFDQTYSLGNDANGFGGRYYNAAARRNCYASLSVEWRRAVKPLSEIGVRN